MTTSFESKPEIPTVQEMKTWDKEKVLQWIRQRDRNILKDDNLEKFNNAYIIGSVFLDAEFDFYYKICGLPPGVGLALKILADEVKAEGKFIPRT
jgi:hypothetical protein